MKKLIKKIFWNYMPLAIQKLLARHFGGFRTREHFGVTERAWYAYGLLSAADQAAKHGFSQIMALEFGVASGRGLRVMQKLATEVTAITGVEIKIVGFDTGKGMPPITDYRDHPENYRDGDYPMLDEAKLRKEVGDDVYLIIGDISETIDDFRDSLDGSTPIGFIAIDVDIYSSSKAALQIMDAGTENYLPMVFSYFDDASSRTHFNKFCGELLAIDEFNQEHDMRKIDIDRGIWNLHRRLGPQIWHERMFITHIFDHPLRFPTKSRKAKIISEY